MAIRNSSKSKSVTSSSGIDCIDLDAIDAALRLIGVSHGGKRPEGFTSAEYAKKKGITDRTAQKHLNALYEQGYVERVTWTPPNGGMKYIYRMKE